MYTSIVFENGIFLYSPLEHYVQCISKNVSLYQDVRVYNVWYTYFIAESIDESANVSKLKEGLLVLSLNKFYFLERNEYSIYKFDFKEKGFLH